MPPLCVRASCPGWSGNVTPICYCVAVPQRNHTQTRRSGTIRQSFAVAAALVSLVVLTACSPTGAGDAVADEPVDGSQSATTEISPTAEPVAEPTAPGVIGDMTVPAEAGGFRLVPEAEWNAFIAEHGSGGYDNPYCGALLPRDLVSMEKVHAFYSASSQTVGEGGCDDFSLIWVIRAPEEPVDYSGVVDANIGGFDCRLFICWGPAKGYNWSAIGQGKAEELSPQEVADVLIGVVDAQG